MALLKRLARTCAVAFLAAFAALPNAHAQDSVRLAEQDIKAGLLYNFLRYTQWPPAQGESGPVVVCVYGRDPFGGRLAPMAGRTVNQRPIEVRGVRDYAEMTRCSLLYISADARGQWPELRAHLARRHVLTVSDFDGFARSGGMIEFTRLNNRVGVRVNVGAAEAVDLQVQSRLLRLATVVRTGGP